MSPDPNAARQHAQLLKGGYDPPINVRMIYGKSGGHSYPLQGRLMDLWSQIEAGQAKDYNAYVVPNDGGFTDASITAIRAVFIDADGVAQPEAWHVEPDFLVTRDATHWHAYWCVSDLAVADFSTAQRRLAAHYGTDPTICNPARLMRLAGTLHLKDPAHPFKVSFTDNTGGLGRSRPAADLLAGLPDAPAPAERKAAQAGVEMDDPDAIDEAVAELKHTTLIARGGEGGNTRTYKMATRQRELGLSEEKCLELMWEHYAPRCEPAWDDFDEFSTVVCNGYRYAQNEAGSRAPAGSAVDTFGALAVAKEAEAPAVETEAERSAQPHGYPRSYSARELAHRDFPRPAWQIERLILESHVNLVVGDGKVGKTYAILHMAVAIAAGLELWGHKCRQAPVLMVLSEDDNGETKHRLGGICGALGVKLETLPIEFWCMPGEALTLARVADNGEVTEGPFLKPLLAKIAETGARCVFLDPLSDFADLDETKRLAANAYCKKVLGPLSHKLGVTIVQTAHPSKASMDDGSVVSGSTAWKNAVRNVLSMERVRGETHGSPKRLLRNAWTNYAEEAELELTLFGGVLYHAGHGPDLEADDTDEKEAVYATAAGMIRKGLRIVQTHGAGQKPADLAKDIEKRTGRRLLAKRVLDVLRELERDGRLGYAHGGNGARGQLAGFYLPSGGAP